MPGRICWYCKRYSNMRWVEGRSSPASTPGYLDLMGAFSCDSCEHLSLGMARIYSHDFFQSVEVSLAAAEEGMEWLPSKPLSETFCTSVMSGRVLVM